MDRDDLVHIRLNEILLAGMIPLIDIVYRIRVSTLLESDH